MQTRKINPDTVYENEPVEGNIIVTFMNGDGKRLVRGFSSPFLAQKFIRKLRYSKKCILVSTDGI